MTIPKHIFIKKSEHISERVGGRTRKSFIHLIFRGVWAKELWRNETYIYQLNSEAGMGKMFNFLELFPP